MDKTRVEALYDFYFISKASMDLPELLFVSAVGNAQVVCREWGRVISKSDNGSVGIVVDWREKILTDFYDLVQNILSDPNPSFLRNAPLIRDAIAVCAEKLGEGIEVPETDVSKTPEISALKLKPGDKVLIKFPDDTPFRYAVSIKTALEEVIPDVDFIVCLGDIDFRVVRLEPSDSSDAANNKPGRRVADENGTHRHPYYQWHPKLDITNYELALCMPVLTGYSIQNVGERYYIEALLPKEASRHFRVAS